MNRLASRNRTAWAAGVTLSVFAWVAHADVPDIDDAGSLTDAPTGPAILYGTRPVIVGDVGACSYRQPLCVHASRGIRATNVLDTLASAERAWEIATDALRLPPPDVDLVTGKFDIYIVRGFQGGAEAELGARDPIASFDRANAFMIVGEGLAGCTLDALIARETTRAILLAVAPAIDSATARAETAYLARLIVPCALEAPGGVDTFQAHPDLSVAGGFGLGEFAETGSVVDRTDYAFGASLFYWWIDWSFGNSPGSVVRALWALAPTRTPVASARWTGRPDGFDVLRASFKNALTTGSTLDNLLLDFAVAREFLGRASDADHMPETRSLGDAARVHADWEIGWPTEPRRLASGRGIEPTGAAYVVIDSSLAPNGARLRIEAEWEEHAKLLWAAVKVDNAGHEKASIAIPSAERATEAHITVVDLEDVAKIILVGMSAGDPYDPFDPNDAVLEPHGWVVSVAAEGP
jgi:hypothetical protein